MRNNKTIWFLLLAGLLTLTLWRPDYLSAAPNLANYYLPWDIADQQARDLAKWDLLILHTQAVDRNPDLLKLIKRHNPKIKILAYFLTQEIAENSITMDPNGAWGKIFTQVNQADWWLKNIAGQFLNYWPATTLIDLTNLATSQNGQIWNHWLPEFIKTNYLTAPADWDGVFYDNCWTNIGWLNFNLDLNRDGLVENYATQDRLWSEGTAELIKYSRQIFPPNKIIVCNGGTAYRQYYQGRMYESFPLASEGGWLQNINDYETTGSFSIINANTGNQGNRENFKTMRFGLASSLLGDGYFSFDYGDLDHGQTWWYDEYDLELGQPLSGKRQIITDVWQKKFTRGLVLINNSYLPASVRLPEKYEKINGAQDPITNNGQLINVADLKANDSLILLKPLTEIIGQTFINGHFARVYNDKNQRLRNGFFTYNNKYAGGVNLTTLDLNHDSAPEIIVGNPQTMAIYALNKKQLEFAPYGNKYSGGASLAVGDLDDNGDWEIVTAPKKNASAHIKTFSLNGRWLNPGFFAYPASFKGGANLALCDINADGQTEIITAPGPGSPLPIKFFSRSGQELNGSFLAFEKNYSGGVNVACGDVNNDGRTEIVVSRQRGSTDIKIFAPDGKLLAHWPILDKGQSGAEVIVTDIDGNSQYEIIILTGQLY